MDAHFRTQPQRGSTAIVGSSMGGLISDHAIHQYPQVFGLAGALSPSYWIAPPIADFDAAHPLPPGAAVTLHVAPEARHNEAAWRAEFPAVVRWLFRLEG